MMAATTAAQHDERRRILDAYAARSRGDYAFSEPWYVQLCHRREALLAAELARAGVRSLEGRRVLEVGCGTGYWLRLFNAWGARPEALAGCDINPERIAEARDRHPAIRFDTIGAGPLPYGDGSFDIVLQSTVFSSVLDLAMRRDLAGEMARVARADGLIAWFDFRYDNPRNRDVRGLGAREVRRLFPSCRVRLRSVGLLPPLARPLARLSPALAAGLERVPPLRYAYLGIIRKGGA